MTFLRGHASGLEGAPSPNHLFARDSSSMADPHRYIPYIFRHRWYISQPLWRYAHSITMRYFPFDRHLASESSWDNPDNFWSADTGHSSS
jgi:hypothetical protein